MNLLPKDVNVQDIKDLRNYFGEHSQSLFEHRAYSLLDSLYNHFKRYDGKCLIDIKPGKVFYNKDLALKYAKQNYDSIRHSSFESDEYIDYTVANGFVWVNNGVRGNIVNVDNLPDIGWWGIYISKIYNFESFPYF